jgi:hypothetical protein
MFSAWRKLRGGRQWVRSEIDIILVFETRDGGANPSVPTNVPVVK